MVQLCPQIGCSGVLHVEADDVGRVVRCKKCGSPLRVEERGLVLLSAPPSTTPPPLREDQPDRPMPRAEPVREARETQETGSMSYPPPARGDVLTALFAWLFTVGVLAVLVFLFLPLLDQSSIVRQGARIEEGNLEQKRLDDRLWGRRGIDLKDKGEPPSEEAIKSRETQRRDWEKRREALEDDLEASRISARGRRHPYYWGMLAGFVILAIASVGFLTRGPSTSRRVLGAVVLAAEILLIFLGHLVTSTALVLLRPF